MKTECDCPDPDDQYLMEIDAGTVYLTHKACGRSPRAWLDDAFSLDRVPVTLHWHDGRPVHPDDDDNSYGVLSINGRCVVHDDVPYLVGRNYRDRENSIWRVTDSVDAQDRPMVYLLPEGAGVDIPLAEAVSDFGPLSLVGSGPRCGRALATGQPCPVHQPALEAR
ncbi:phiSA1p31-related protein [Streptomyces europaeiscabiei]|uniref:phiSA1p31-related protein n=1 Tax=Streptomyces europaeiscabiei TaxID=146819 RepID=UPI0029BDBA79|nr:phiSA1p31-related protein [Streptomyces europaeiscabiei]MDX3672668.1 phiSA1p31-related protein [Streptomyces europaeiscabiei]